MNAPVAFAPHPPRAAPWALAGVVMSGYAAALRRRDLLDSLRPRLSAATRQIVDHPPLAIVSFDGSALDELLTAVQDLGGDEVIRQVTEDACRSCFGPLLRPLVTSTLALFGRTPAALFRNFSSLAAPLVRHVAFNFESFDETSGLLELVFPTPPPDATIVAWEGIARFIITLAARTPDVRGNQVAFDRRQAFIPVRWS